MAIWTPKEKNILPPIKRRQEDTVLYPSENEPDSEPPIHIYAKDIPKIESEPKDKNASGMPKFYKVS